MTALASRSGPGAQEPLSAATEATGGHLSTGCNARSSGEDATAEPGASLHSSRELPAGASTRTRTASELLLNRSVPRVAGGGCWGGRRGAHDTLP